MNNLNLLAALIISSYSLFAQQPAWQNFPVYTGSDLGLTYSPTQSFFRIYAPTATACELLLFREAQTGEAYQRIAMQPAEHGTWTATIPGDQQGIFYTFRIKQNDTWRNDVPDPYVKSVGVNGRRGLILDLRQTNPPGWDKDVPPPFKNKTDAIIYELHVRDATIHPSARVADRGKFLGLTQTGTKNKAGLSTALDHIRELGVTHVHLLPVFDYNSLDESLANNPKYNWGYDPLNYNVPEGTYATDAHTGAVRIREFKQLIQTFHQNGLRVVMDVVYNHTARTENSYFNELVPGYYYRQTPEGTFSNGSACGNETASDRPMMRKFIIESLLYWVNEYHVDGFRFDLMGIHDIETMNRIAQELHSIRPDILLYGEGWTAGEVQLPTDQQALKTNVAKLDRIAVFSDDIRDGIKGSVFNHRERGFASGLTSQDQSIRFGVTAACPHPQVEYSQVKYARQPYATAPHQVIAYFECHDNHVLPDKLAICFPESTELERKNIQKLALSIVLTSQGIPFLHAGSEFLRTKQGIENSYESPDEVNAIDWNLKTMNQDVVEYVKHLIALRKEHPAFRFTTAEDITKRIHFDDTTPEGIVAFTIDATQTGDTWQSIYVVYNGSEVSQKINLKSSWKASVLNNAPANSSLKTLTVQPYSCSILYKK